MSWTRPPTTDADAELRDARERLATIRRRVEDRELPALALHLAELDVARAEAAVARARRRGRS